MRFASGPNAATCVSKVIRAAAGSVGSVPVDLRRPAAGRRYIRSDHECQPVRVRGRTPGDFCQFDCPQRGGVVIQALGLSGAALRAIEMDLGESRCGVSGNQCPGFRHCVRCGCGAPASWPQVIASKDQPIDPKADILRNSHDQTNEVFRLHPGIATLLTDLIRGRFDDQGLVQILREEQGGAQHIGMRGADRW